MSRMKQFAALAGGVLVASGAVAQENPFAQPDESWISISGTVVDPEADTFTLDYGQGLIEVEMDDWDTYREAYALLDGDKVTVYGRIDDALFETSKIEADSIYAESLNTYFYASDVDEEGDVHSPYFWEFDETFVLPRATLRGTVTSVDPMEREFTIDTGPQQITVETTTLNYDPLDASGFQRIEVGDRVSVTGDFDSDFVEGREFEADRIITLSDADLDVQAS